MHIQDLQQFRFITGRLLNLCVVFLHPSSCCSFPQDGKVSQLEHVFIRGSKVRFMVIPDMLKNAPMFKRLDARIKGKSTSLGVGRGRSVAMRAKAQAAGRAAPGRGAVPPVRR
ncbi:small nuclear ribonucleoprotein SmD3b isoform X2 [Manihot esculenta]|uniref:small nuclear ribonucleoprotein SmD3b isoform X2 n=1 Tax=Manihot esculenta TaxID=3983 RepID=UPI001CC52A41|nr:small nuclear ribonucleoprotein SmD3b isoform X2 [Manihot esculenta]